MRSEIPIFGCSALLAALAVQPLPLTGPVALLVERPALQHLFEAGLLLGSITGRGVYRHPQPAVAIRPLALLLEC